MADFNLTEEDLAFLLDLQHEMKTQDNVGQAAPRYWVVATDKEERVVPEGYEDTAIIFDNNANERKCEADLSKAIEHFMEEYAQELEEANVLFSFGNDKWIGISGEPGTDDYDETNIYDVDDLLSFLDANDIIDESQFSVMSLSYNHYNYPDTLFLTNRGCKKHIEQYGYNYNSDAHSYAMTAVRSPEVERLFNILDKINWNEIRRYQNGENKV